MEKTTRRLPIVERDEWLLPAERELNNRHERYMDTVSYTHLTLPTNSRV